MNPVKGNDLIKCKEVCMYKTDPCNNIHLKSIEDMYGDFNLSQYSIFAGGWINFGYWHNLLSENDLSITDRIESQKNLYRKVLNQLKIFENDNVLEVGCGLGQGSSLILEEYNPLSVIGLDFSQAQIDRANIINKDKIDHFKSRLVFQKGNAENIPFDCNKFEKLISIEAAQHFYNIQLFASEAFRVLKSQGVLVIATFFRNHNFSLEDLGEIILTIREKIDFVYPILEFYEILSDVGFESIKIESIGENVWMGFDRWISQSEFKDSWDRNWAVAYKEKMIDYYVVTATKK